MTSPRAVVVYRRLLWLYPRSFRDEYASDMALLFADQLRDEPPHVSGLAAPSTSPSAFLPVIWRPT